MATDTSEEESAKEELAKLCQSILSNRPALVLGSGATIPFGLPSMYELSQHLLATICSTEEDWLAFAEKLAETNDLELSLHEAVLSEELTQRVVNATWELMNERDIHFYESLLNDGQNFPLARLFSFLLRTSDACLDVVTTNYDRAPEYAANLVNAQANTGMTPGWIQRFSPDYMLSKKRIECFEGLVTILKVHGSLDWFVRDNNTISGINQITEIPESCQPLIVTPGVSKYKETHKDPFRTVISAADKVLRSAGCFVCIGYGFNDDHIQPVILDRVRNSNVPILCIAKNLTEKTIELMDSISSDYLFVEEHKEGTCIYSAQYPKGRIYPNEQFWVLESFLDLSHVN